MSPLKVLLDCLDNDTGWIALNLLNLNEQKTEAIVFGPCDLYDFGPLGIYKKKPFARSFGVIFDSN